MNYKKAILYWWLGCLPSLLFQFALNTQVIIFPGSGDDELYNFTTPEV